MLPEVLAQRQRRTDVALPIDNDFLAQHQTHWVDSLPNAIPSAATRLVGKQQAFLNPLPGFFCDILAQWWKHWVDAYVLEQAHLNLYCWSWWGGMDNSNDITGQKFE